MEGKNERQRVGHTQPLKEFNRKKQEKEAVVSGGRCVGSKKGFPQGELFQTFLGGDLINRM